MKCLNTGFGLLEMSSEPNNKFMPLRSPSMPKVHTAQPRDTHYSKNHGTLLVGNMHLPTHYWNFITTLMYTVPRPIRDDNPSSGSQRNYNRED